MKYLKWVSMENLACQYVCRCVDETDKNGRYILLESENENNPHKLEVDFRGAEISQSVIYGEFEHLYKKTEFLNWTFYEVEQSEYIDWITEHSYDILSGSKFEYRHFFILTKNCLIDVIALDEPVLKIIKPTIGSLSNEM